MKRVMVTLLVATVVSAGAPFAFGTQAAGPEADEVVASFFLRPRNIPPSNQCTGEDGGNYLKQIGVWRGGSIDSSPGPGPDVPLDGSLTVRATFTINESTGIGVATGTVSLSNATNSGFDASEFNGVAREANGRIKTVGFLSALLVDHWSHIGDRLLANLKLSFDLGSGDMTGTLGGGTSGGLAVEYNGATC